LRRSPARTPRRQRSWPTATGKGRVFCLACPRSDDVDVPLTVDDVDHWELCPSCGRHVVDVARATETPRPS
ncbi:hypothetical protein, partial [Streptomyces caniscabiei]|uniref:hypothetical protein n=1 Tax=Streptomyces caniscabiei TaxID=2746961 RepID=UPI0029A0C31D